MVGLKQHCIRKQAGKQAEPHTSVDESKQHFIQHTRSVSEREEASSNFELPEHIREELALHEIHDLKSIFSALDTDQDGFLNYYGIKMALFGLGFISEDCDMDRPLKLFELTGNTGIQLRMYSLTQFIELIIALQRSGTDRLDTIAQAFRYFDTESAGRISLTTLEKLTAQVGMELRNEDLVNMIEKADQDGDGFVDQTEFTDIMLRTNLFE
ncbi:hypothetical protein D915_005457 [Fasciola hepatica]|uniref:EF-hand domain-containing protein n=1 Tax=Fasciola hepatica TaxID=6192 RepID=A0A4E0S0N9_FASHE|nr:hypothetical protein D915_005457 [Fasciola hepatica]